MKAYSITSLNIKCINKRYYKILIAILLLIMSYASNISLQFDSVSNANTFYLFFITFRIIHISL